MERTIKKVFIGTQLIIYVLFMYLDIFHQSLYITSNYLKFISIIICALYVIITYPNRHEGIDRWLLVIAILLTLVSDWFILIRDIYTYGLITFIVVQYLYLIRIHRQNKKLTVAFFLKKLLLNIGVTSCIISFLLFVQVEVDRLVVLSIFYFVTFILNVIQGIYEIRKGKVTSKDKSFIIFIVGMLLFFLCDVNVGIYNLTSYLSINANWFTAIENFSEVAMWMFYLPSQVLISISSLSK